MLTYCPLVRYDPLVNPHLRYALSFRDTQDQIAARFGASVSELRLALSDRESRDLVCKQSWDRGIALWLQDVPAKKLNVVGGQLCPARLSTGRQCLQRRASRDTT